jgi:hypothetical protein
MLRLAIALDNDTNAIAAIFHFIWQKGGSIENEQSWKTQTLDTEKSITYIAGL